MGIWKNRDGSEKRGFKVRTRLTRKSLHYLVRGLQSKGNKGEADISEHSGKNTSRYGLDRLR